MLHRARRVGAQGGPGALPRHIDRATHYAKTKMAYQAAQIREAVMPQQVILAGTIYPSKAKATDRVKEILWCYQPGQRLSPEDELIMLDLLQMHPNVKRKIGDGIDYIGIGSPPEFPNTRCFWIYRQDGTGTDFSYKECFRPSTHRENALVAMRRGISGDIRAYKQRMFAGKDLYTCPVLGTEHTVSDTHVDHPPPVEFETLVQDFLTRERLRIEDIEYESVDGMAGCLISDPTVLASWIEFHDMWSNLWLISRRAHVEVTKLRLNAGKLSVGMFYDELSEGDAA